MGKYYLGKEANLYLPFNHFIAMQWYYFPNALVTKWQKQPAAELNSYINRLKMVDGSAEEGIYDHIQIYIHIPYCKAFCFYCPFTKKAYPRQDPEEMDIYVDYLIKELKAYLEMAYIRSKKICAVTIGGGSPSVIPVKSLERLFSYLKENLPEYDSLEKTFTGEPGSLKNPELLKLLKSFGWNKLTFGIETLNADCGKQIGRHLSIKDIEAVYANLSKYNFHVPTCVDLMYNLPGQSLEMLMEDVKILIRDFQPHTVDTLSLVYLPQLKLWRRIVQGKAKQPANIWDVLKMREFLYDYFTDNGYNNILSETFSRNNKPFLYHEGRCSHHEVIPAGVAAQGSYKAIKSLNPHKVEDWMKNIDDNGISVMGMKYMGLEGEFLRNVVMFPRYKTLSKKYLSRFREAGNYRRIMHIIAKHIRLGLVDEHEDSYKVNKLGVIWHPNMQIDFGKHAFNLFGKIFTSTVRFPKRAFSRKLRFKKLSMAHLLWKLKEVVPTQE